MRNGADLLPFGQNDVGIVLIFPHEIAHSHVKRRRVLLCGKHGIFTGNDFSVFPHDIRYAFFQQNIPTIMCDCEITFGRLRVFSVGIPHAVFDVYAARVRSFLLSCAQSDRGKHHDQAKQNHAFHNDNDYFFRHITLRNKRISQPTPRSRQVCRTRAHPLSRRTAGLSRPLFRSVRSQKSCTVSF